MSSQPSESVAGWVASNRLYETYLFFYALILVFWAAVGFFTLGFELPGHSQQANLLWNFLWFLLLAAAMAYTPFWHRLIFKRSIAQRQAERKQEIRNYLVRFPRQEWPQIYRALQEQEAGRGDLPPSRIQIGALVLLG